LSTPENYYIIERVRIGNQIKVSACDPESGTEVSVFGPASAGKKELSDLAVKKLLYVMNKAAKANSDEA
jgi:hypothetical protein